MRNGMHDQLWPMGDYQIITLDHKGGMGVDAKLIPAWHENYVHKPDFIDFKCPHVLYHNKDK